MSGRSLLALSMVAVIAGCGPRESAASYSGESDPSPASDSVAGIPTTGSPTTVTGAPGAGIALRYRLLIDGAPVGGVWTTGLANTDVEWTALWESLDLTGDQPAVEFDTSVVVYFAPAESSSCPFGPLEGVQYDPVTGWLYPVLPIKAQPAADGLFECTADARSHAVLVAIDRTDLPPSAFNIWVDDSEPPQCCSGEVTPIDKGELQYPPVTP